MKFIQLDNVIMELTHTIIEVGMFDNGGREIGRPCIQFRTSNGVVRTFYESEQDRDEAFDSLLDELNVKKLHSLRKAIYE